MAELRLALLVIGLLCLNVFTSFRHSNYYKKTVNDIVQSDTKGYLGVGMTQSKFKKRSIVLMVANLDGTIKECQVMSGLTIFAKFKRFKEIDGYNISAVPIHYLNGKYGEALKQSIAFIENEKKYK